MRLVLVYLEWICIAHIGMLFVQLQVGALQTGTKQKVTFLPDYRSGTEILNDSIYNKVGVHGCCAVHPWA